MAVGDKSGHVSTIRPTSAMVGTGPLGTGTGTQILAGLVSSSWGQGSGSAIANTQPADNTVTL